MARMLQSAKPGVSKEDWIPTRLWNKIIERMPIPCVDIIFQRPDSRILYGWRLISPYRNLWALLGGRIFRGEGLLQCASRIAKEYGLTFDQLYLNGVFPVNFPKRSDIVISLVANYISGEPRVDKFEFSKFTWSRTPPKRLGKNYLLMVRRWNHVTESKNFIRRNRLRR
ncbi:MAG: NUDIX domain-containing protein [Candidatus Bathyarchaeia archaeon]